MMEVKPLVSIIIPCFNTQTWIGRAIESCIKQSYRPLEILVVDDGSTDKSASIIEGYSARYPEVVRSLSQPNRGAPAARNHGLREALGEYIQWLDADDLLEPDKIGQQVNFLERYPEIDGVYSDWKQRTYVADLSDCAERVIAADLPDFLMDHVSGRRWVPVHAFLIRRELANTYAWDESLAALQDHDYWIQLSLRGARFTYFHQSALAVYCSVPSRNHTSRVDRRKLLTQLDVSKKIEESLRLNGHLQNGAYRLALARAYMGAAHASRCVAKCEDLVDIFFERALQLTTEAELRTTELTFPIYGFLGLYGSLRLAAAQKRLKESFKDRLYQLVGFEHAWTWRENIRKGLTEQ